MGLPVGGPSGSTDDFRWETQRYGSLTLEAEPGGVLTGSVTNTLGWDPSEAM